jgi:hypothetical protein
VASAGESIASLLRELVQERRFSKVARHTYGYHSTSGWAFLLNRIIRAPCDVAHHLIGIIGLNPRPRHVAEPAYFLIVNLEVRISEEKAIVSSFYVTHAPSKIITQFHYINGKCLVATHSLGLLYLKVSRSPIIIDGNSFQRRPRLRLPKEPEIDTQKRKAHNRWNIPNYY